MSGVSRGGGTLQVDEFQYDLMKKLGNNEDRIRENFEQIILKDEKTKQKLLSLEGIDADKHNSREVRKHLNKEVEALLHDLYGVIENGEGIEAIEKYLEKVEGPETSHPPVENCEQLGELVTEGDLVPGKFKNLLKAMGSIALAGMTTAIAIIYLTSYMPEIHMSIYAFDFMMKSSPSMIMMMISLLLAGNAKSHLEEIPSFSRFFDGMKSLEKGLVSVFG